MRSFLVCLLATAFLLSSARADEADERAFRYVIASYLQTHPLQFPADLLNLPTEGYAKVTFSIDRDGKLVDAKISSGSGSSKADQDILDWLTGLQPFPRIPAEVSAPAKFSEEIMLVPTKLKSDVKIKWLISAGARAKEATKEAAFRDQVASHLQHLPRTYTAEMKARHTIVALSLDLSGKLLNAELIKASGSPAIDEETLAWLKAAQPFPQIPTDLTAPLKLTADIEFGQPRKSVEGIWDDGKIKRAINNVCKGC